MKFEPYIFLSYGLLIVFSGLTFLAIAVSNIHTIISFFGKMDIKRRILRNRNIKIPPLSIKKVSLIENFIVLTKGEKVFSLPLLIRKGEQTGMENPWEVIDIMIKKKIITPDNQGKFLWNKDSSCYKKINKINKGR